ncbi:3-isopropylmalate dehydratase small subunit [Aureispira anguillae]|uniref:3-isopropylmalate dehydratase small subunit n=1 Tax=Aureispira anguillae TaxID=2864201 RepID=A0A915YI23_9BACT|nr:3-isopropylmalate dehydratase small subunit [Aureispira anguillae]BDS13463.1 3-isopropylmalate dehydratase small subunit [Aureispira anguillae]
MKIIKTIKSTAIPLPIENIDTDQIIPARFLKAIDQKGFGAKLFNDWRYFENGALNPDFVLNDKRFSGGVLVAGRNFGCGSSREHAAWALADYGIQAVVSSYFADIFKGNALNNGLLPIQVSEAVLEEIIQLVYDRPNTTFTIDLEEQKLLFNPNRSIFFEIDQYKKMCLLKGQSDLDYLLSLEDKIAEFETTIIY